MGSFKVIEHTADIAVEIGGSDLPDLFRTAASAWKEAVIGEVNQKEYIELKLSITGSSIETLLVDFINELNYFLTVKKFFCSEVSILNINGKIEESFLDCLCNGFYIEADEIELKEEIKSVTYHKMNIVKTDAGYSTMIVFDI